jgi:hypothetical protein
MDEIATPAQIEEFQTLYGLDPEMLENILWSQASHAKAGREMTLEDTYFLEVDASQRDAWERQRQSPNEQFSAPLESRYEEVARGLVRDGLAKTLERAREMVDEAI